MKKKIILILLVLVLLGLLTGCTEKENSILVRDNKIDDEKEVAEEDGKKFDEKILENDIEVDIMKDIENDKKDINMDLDTGSEIELHFFIENGRPIFVDEKLFESPFIVKKGDIIRLIEDNNTGLVDSFIVSDGLENLDESKNSFLVRGDGIMDISIRVNSDLYVYKFISLNENTPNLYGQALRAEDFYIRTSQGKYLSLDYREEEVMELFSGGFKEEIGVSVHDESIVLYSLKKDGIEFLYYDDPNDEKYDIVFDMFLVDSPDHSTFRGLKVGDSYEKMLEMYNTPSNEYSYEGDITYFYESDDPEGFLGFAIIVDEKTKLVTDFTISHTF